ncbi:MAG: hypothetical protein HYY25_15370 [Candidatus Wallbacteria bacterium]|nr:hypothetical protein [Candidatus Wallbacteria bacterium]
MEEAPKTAAPGSAKQLLQFLDAIGENMRRRRVLEWGSRIGFWSVVSALVTLLLWYFAQACPAWVPALVLGFGLGGAAVLAALSPRPPAAAVARFLDARLKGQERYMTAEQCAREGGTNDVEVAFLEQIAGECGGMSPGRLVPVEPPWETWGTVSLFVATLVFLLLWMAQALLAHWTAPAVAPPVEQLVQQMKKVEAELKKPECGKEANDVASKLSKLLDDLAKGKKPDPEAVRKALLELPQVQKALEQQGAKSPKLGRVAQFLSKSNFAEKMDKALQDNDMQQVADLSRELAQSIQDTGSKQQQPEQQQQQQAGAQDQAAPGGQEGKPQDPGKKKSAGQCDKPGGSGGKGAGAGGKSASGGQGSPGAGAGAGAGGKPGQSANVTLSQGSGSEGSMGSSGAGSGAGQNQPGAQGSNQGQGSGNSPGTSQGGKPDSSAGADSSGKGQDAAGKEGGQESGKDGAGKQAGAQAGKDGQGAGSGKPGGTEAGKDPSGGKPGGADAAKGAAGEKPGEGAGKDGAGSRAGAQPGKDGGGQKPDGSAGGAKPGGQQQQQANGANGQGQSFSPQGPMTPKEKDLLDKLKQVAEGGKGKSAEDVLRDMGKVLDGASSGRSGRTDAFAQNVRKLASEVRKGGQKGQPGGAGVGPGSGGKDDSKDAGGNAAGDDAPDTKSGEGGQGQGAGSQPPGVAPESPEGTVVKLAGGKQPETKPGEAGTSSSPTGGVPVPPKRALPRQIDDPARKRELEQHYKEETSRYLNRERVPAEYRELIQEYFSP